jgi:hypothetical protein
MTPPDRLRWTDSRLDDRFATLVDEQRALRDLPQTMGKFEVEMGYIRDDVKECAENVKAHSQAFRQYVEAQEQAAKDERQERKRLEERHRDANSALLKWVITAILATGMLIVGAMTLILGQIH